VQGELVVREDPVLVLYRDSKMKGEEQLLQQFNRLQPQIQVSLVEL
jgi:hypothetical protein